MIAKNAMSKMSKNTGARGLRAILENILMDAMHEIPDVKSGAGRIDAVVVDEAAVGSVDQPGSGAKVLRCDGALDRYLSERKEMGGGTHCSRFRCSVHTDPSLILLLARPRIICSNQQDFCCD